MRLGPSAASVMDTKVGIAAEEQPKALEEFLRVAFDQTLKSEGTGVGLTLAKKHGALA